MEKEEKIGTEKLGFKGQVNEKIKSIMDSNIPEDDLKEFQQKLIETATSSGEDKISEAIEKIKEGVALIKDPEFKGLALSMVMNELPLGMQLQLYRLQGDLAKTIVSSLFASQVKNEMTERPEVALETAIGLLGLVKDLKKDK